MVIAVIAILAALLLPALHRAKAKAYEISCLSNLKQLQAGYIMYVMDNNETLPVNLPFWDGSISDWSESPGSWVVGNAPHDSDTTNLQGGTIYAYVRSVSVYHCPADRSTIIGTSLLRIRTYSLDEFLHHPEAPGAVWKATQVRSPPPTDVFVFIDENEIGIEDGNFGMLRAPGDRWLNLPSDRHGRGSTASFFDGHGKRLKWRAPKPYLGSAQAAFSPDDLKDLRDLQAAIPDPVDNE